MASLIKKRAKSYVTTLIVDEKKVTDHVEIRETFVKYFRTFYKSKHINHKQIQDYLKKFETKLILEEIKVELNKEVSTEEILNVIKDMKLNKSPGSVGLQLFFIKV